jgi:hypothetical protein
VAGHEQAPERWHAASTGAQHPEQGGGDRQGSYPVPDLKGATDAPRTIVHPVIPCPRIVR